MSKENMERRLKATRLINHLTRPCEGTHSQFKGKDIDELMQLFYDSPECEKGFLFEYLFFINQR